MRPHAIVRTLLRSVVTATLPLAARRGRDPCALVDEHWVPIAGERLRGPLTGLVDDG